MKIEVLHVAECPGHPAALRLVRNALAEERMSTKTHEVRVVDERTARELRLCGSPTIRINGRDIGGDPLEPGVYGLHCRWCWGSNPSGLPAVELIQREIAKARQKDES